MKTSQADQWFSRCIRAQAKYTCERCGAVHDKSSTGLHCSHIFSRRHRTIRWCKDNCQALCFSCHQWFGGNPVESGQWIRDIYGDGFVDLLIEKKNSKTKVPKSEEADIAKHYRNELKKLEQDPDYEFVSWQ